MKILFVDSWYSGSHKQWIDGIQKYSKHEIEILGLKGVHWKWRMHGGAISIAEKIKKLDPPDLIICSDMMDVALFKSLLPDKFSKIPLGTYFHENQFAYPISPDDKNKETYQFGFINYSTALVSDFILYNSEYNKDSFILGIEKMLKAMPDYKEAFLIESIIEKSQIMPLGCDLKNVFIGDNKKDWDNPLVLWNHRWDHDKNPELFFKTLIRLAEESVTFKLAVLGKPKQGLSYIFHEARSVLGERIIQWGEAPREEYLELIKKATHIPITSNQDFFGISAIEGMVAGAKPLLPNRLAFPEHLSPEFSDLLWNDEQEYYLKLKASLSLVEPFSNNLAKELLRYDWESMIPKYDSFFETFL